MNNAEKNLPAEGEDQPHAVLIPTISDVNEPSRQISPLSYEQSFKQILVTAGPFTLSTVFLSITTICNGIVLQKLGNIDVAAGALVSTISGSVFSTGYGFLCTTGIFVGQKYGEIKINPSQSEEVGAIARRGWIIGGLLSIPSFILTLNANSILKASGTDSMVANTVQDYFNALSYGVIPFYLYISDQQLLLGLNKQKAIMISGIANSLMTMAFSYPLALGFMGLPSLGIAGLGYGAALSNVMSLMALRLYFSFHGDYKSYGLKKIKPLGSLQDILNYLKIGLPIGLQNLAGWGNLAVITIIAGKLGKTVLAAEQTSVIPMTAYTFLVLALAQATAVTISNHIGLSKGALQNSDHLSYRIAQANAKRIGYASLIIGGASSLIICGIFVGIPRQLSSLFIDTTEPDAEEILTLAQAMLIINGVGLVADSIRNISSANLQGYRDVIYAPLLSFMTMTLMGLSIGGALTLALDCSPTWLFITRDIGILLAAIAIAYRFFKTKPRDEETLALNENVAPDSANVSVNDIPARNYSPRLFQSTKERRGSETQEDSMDLLEQGASRPT